MVDMPIEASTAERLTEIAKLENRPVNEVLVDMLEQYQTTTTPNVTSWAREMARMADTDNSDVWKQFAPDLAARSRAILDEEFADYLTQDKKLNRDE